MPIRGRHLDRVAGALIPLLASLAAIALCLPAGAVAAECTATWVGPAEGTWQTASNWSTEEVPTSSDVACIGSGKTSKVTAGSHEVSVVQGEGTLKIRESTLEVLNTEEPSVIGSLVVEYNADLTGPATVRVVEFFEWAHASKMSGEGATVLQSGSTGAITTGGGWAELEERTLVTEGAFSVNEGILRLKENAVLENKGTLTVNHETGVFDIFAPSESGAMLVNRGVLQKTSGTGETHIEVDLENEGEINAETGNFGFTQDGATGLLADESIIKGSMRLEGPTFTGEDFEGGEADLTIREATLAIANGHIAEIGPMTLDYEADIAGEGTLEIIDEVLWKSRSSMSGIGTTVVAPSGEVTITTYHGELIERTLVNEGTFTLEGEGTLREKEGAVFENVATFFANAVVSYARFPGVIGSSVETPPLFVNDGVVRKTVGTSDTRMNVDFENYGDIEVETGTLLFEQAGTTATFTSGSSLEGDLHFEEAGIAGEDFTLEPGSLTVRESPVVVEGDDTSIENLKIEYGTSWSGSGDFEVSNVFDWHGQSTLGGSGTTTLGQASENILNSGATDATLSGRELLNEGTFTQISSSRLKLAGEATLRNKGTYNLNSEPYPTWVRDSIRYEGEPASGRVINEGTFQRTEGELSLEVTPLFENLGVLNPQSSGIEIEHPVAVDRSVDAGFWFLCGDPVNCATGDLSESQTDLLIEGRGVPLDLTRTYSAQAAAEASSAGAFGYGWTGSFSEHLVVEEEGEAVTLLAGNGSTVPFTKIGEGAYSGPTWSQNTLSGSPEAGYTLTTADQTELAFSGAGKLESATDRNGNKTTLAYDESGRLETVTDPASRQLIFAYNEGGQVESVEDPMENLVEYAYEGGELASVTLPGEEAPRWEFEYDGTHRLTKMTDGREGETTNEYDGEDRVKAQTDPGGHTLTFEYEAFHTTTTNESTGAVTDQWFTSNNQPYSITRGYGTEDATTETFTYDAAAQRTSATDGNGHTTSFGYDEEGNLTSEEDAEGNETKWTYNETHDIVSVTTPGGETTTITHDGDGNPETISRPGPGETSQIYSLDFDEDGQIESLTDPLERTWSYDFDGEGNLVGETDPLGNMRSGEFDENSRLVAVVTPRGNLEGVEASDYEWTLERDQLGRITKITDPICPWHTTEYSYDGNGNLSAVTDALNHTTKVTYNANDERTKVEKPNGAVLETGYDGAGRVTSQTDGNEKTTTFVRNALGQPVEVIDPLSRKTTREFDAAGNLEALTDPDSRETGYAYDKADRLTEVNFSEESTPDLGYEYDADGNLTAMTDGTGASSFAYDELGRLTESETGHGESVEFGYDLADGLTEIVYPNGESVSREFDGAGRLESVTDWLGGTTSFAYDSDYNLETVTYPSESGNVNEYAYDEAGWMSEASFKGGSETLASIDYERNMVGQVKGETSTGLPGENEAEYDYDENSRLIGAGEVGFEYDAADNLIEGLGSANEYDAASQLEAGTGVAYAYGKLGERTKATPESGPAITYGYDQAGSLTSIERPEEGEVPAIGESFAYDGIGLVASRTAGMTTHQMTWDVGAELPLLLSDGEDSYIYGPGGMAVEQISEEGEEEPTYLHRDQLGSARLLTDAGGEVAATFTYGPFGALAASTGSATTPMGFAGQYTDAATGLQYLRARFYDPSTAQFLSRDPQEALTRQPYAYSFNDPVNLTDPGGENPAVGACVVTVEIPIVGEVTCAAAAVTVVATGAAVVEGLVFPDSTAEDDLVGAPPLSQSISRAEVDSSLGDEAECIPSDTPNFDDPSQPPGEDWEWRGNGSPGSKEGAWHNPKTGESLHPDLRHGGKIKPHYDYRAPNGSKHRVYPDGRSVPK